MKGTDSECNRNFNTNTSQLEYISLRHVKRRCMHLNFKQWGRCVLLQVFCLPQAALINRGPSKNHSIFNPRTCERCFVKDVKVTPPYLPIC